MLITPNIEFSPAASLIGSTATLDWIEQELQEGRIASGLDELVEHLRARREGQPESWPEYARICRNHPICGLLHQDPFTYRAFSKPRGYAGDAVMMDYIYGIGEAREEAQNATPLGRAILQHFSNRPALKGVRQRRRLLAETIDRVAESGGSRVLAIAAGHLREVELSRAVQHGELSNFVAFDQDEASLAIVRRDYSRLGVQSMPGSVRQILARKMNLGHFDLVYAAGLFDYLAAPVAATLACQMFEMTRPGGTTLIPNFLTALPDSGYMEAYMDWHLIYRDHSNMQALADALPQGDVADCKIFDDPESAITYLLARKKK